MLRPLAVERVRSALSASTSGRCYSAAFVQRHGAGRLVTARAASAAAAPAPATGDEYPHVPVLLSEVLEAFRPVKLKTYVDCTLGAGGHATAVLREHPELSTLVGIDVDPTAHAIAQGRIAGVGRQGLATHFVRGNYSDVASHLHGLPGGLHGTVDGMLMDLGISSMQVDTAERGFSMLKDGPIDMRMDPTATLSAEEILNTWSEAQLARIIRDYGEEKMWRAVARRVVTARELEPIRTTQQLVKVIGQTQLQGKGPKKGKGIHPATRTFQALRIAVNDELGRLEKALPEAIQALAPKGRLAVISFHSLEDRVVKHAFARAAGKPTPDNEAQTYGDGRFTFLEELERAAVAKLVTRKPQEASAAEVDANPRSRSAKLRVLERL